MPTYADLYNESLAALGQSGSSTPVSLTISKGDYVFDPQTSRFVYEEQWEEEHLMDHEELTDDNHFDTTPSNDNADSRDSPPPLIAALQPSNLHGGYIYQPSLWVLDTNTLMSSLDLLKALFAALLTRNVAYASSLRQQPVAATRPSLIKLVIPYVVIFELDGLKITRRKNDAGRPVASQAREANHWLLSAIQKQKRVPIDETGSNLPEELWPLHLQASTHYNRSKRSTGNNDSSWMSEDALSCDDEIVKFCADLKGQTSASVCFCSDDVNARTKAELDGVDSLGMREMANALMRGQKGAESGEGKWIMVADALIDQWEYQIGTAQQQNDSHHQKYAATYMQQNIDQAACQSAPHDGYTQPVHSSSHHTPSAPTIANEIVEVDMDTEDHHPIAQVGPTPIPLTSFHPAPPTMRAALSAEGRRINDSIHSPLNAQNSTRSRSDRSPVSPSRHQPAAPTASGDAGRPLNESEALNPQIDWEDLIKQHGKSPRASNRQKHNRW